MDSFYTRTTSISSSLQVRLTMDSFYTRTTSISSSLWELRSLSDTSSAEHNNSSGATITKSRSSLSPTLESTLQVDRKPTRVSRRTSACGTSTHWSWYTG